MAEETILTGDDLMTGPPSPALPPELAPAVLAGVDVCSASLRALFECLHKQEVEPFCQDEIISFNRCTQERDKSLRARMMEEETNFVNRLSLPEVEERVQELQAKVLLLERRMVLASVVGGSEGFQQRWRLHGELQDTKSRAAIVERRATQLQQNNIAPAPRRWFFF